MRAVEYPAKVSNNPLSRSDLHLQLTALYLEWINDWLTIEKFCEHHGIPESAAKKLLTVGEELHERDVKQMKVMRSG